MEFMLAVVVLVSMISFTVLYMYLIDNEKIEPYIPSKIQRGNFWDAETKQFYKWDELMKLKKEREQSET